MRFFVRYRKVVAAEDRGRFAPCASLYLAMIEKQLTYDALKIIGFDMQFAESLLAEMRFLQAPAETGKTLQGRIIARKERG